MFRLRFATKNHSVQSQKFNESSGSDGEALSLSMRGVIVMHQCPPPPLSPPPRHQDPATPSSASNSDCPSSAYMGLKIMDQTGVPTAIPPQGTKGPLIGGVAGSDFVSALERRDWQKCFCFHWDQFG